MRDYPIKIKAEPGCAVSEKVFVVGKYDFDGMNFLLENINESDVFYDIGANIGPFSLLVSLITKRIYAFEGHPRTTERLKYNFSLNNINTDRALNLAITSNVGYIQFKDQIGSSVNHILEDSNVGVTVPATSIDVFSNENELPTFIKIDTEGHELEIFRGMANTLALGKIKMISFEANGLSTLKDLQEIYETLTKYNYKVGLVDFENKTFQTKTDLGKKSETGDYQAISSVFLKEIEQKGYEILISN